MNSIYRYLINKKHIYLLIVLVAFCLWTLSNILSFINEQYVNLVFADAWVLIDRYKQLLEGKMSLLHYLFDKHGGHYHTILFILSYFDIKFFSGTGVFLSATNVILNLVSIFIFVWFLVIDKSLSFLVKNLLVALTFILFLHTAAYEMWALPFQVVVTTNRFFLLLSVIVFAFFLKNGGRLFSILTFITGSLATFAYGSGVIVWPVYFIIALYLRNKKGVLTAALGFIFLVFIDILFSRDNLPMHLMDVITSLGLYPLKFVHYGLVSIGIGIVRSPVSSTVAGSIGLIFFMFNFVYLFKNKDLCKKSILVKTCLLFSFFTLLTAFIGSLFRISVAHVFNFVPDINQFFASRYVVNASGFWVSTVILFCLLCFDFFKFNGSNKKVSVITMTLILLGVIVFSQKENFRLRNRDTVVAQLSEVKSMLMTGLFDKSYVDFLSSPNPENTRLDLVDYLKDASLSVYAENLNRDLFVNGVPKTALNGKVDGFYNYNSDLSRDYFYKDRPFTGYRFYGHFLSENLDEKVVRNNPTIYLVNERNRIVGYAAFSRRPPVISIDNEQERQINFPISGFVDGNEPFKQITPVLVNNLIK